jgi:hypothetical protein
MVVISPLPPFEAIDRQIRAYPYQQGHGGFIEGAFKDGAVLLAR